MTRGFTRYHLLDSISFPLESDELYDVFRGRGSAILAPKTQEKFPPDD